MSHAIQCRCGKLKGSIHHPEKAVRGVCYCRDCQAYAHFLGGATTTLDENGGTEVVATQPKYISFSSGTEVLACLSLTERGLLRWYASCCNMPIANTLRNFKLPYVGIVHSCLGEAEDIERSFGPVRMRVNTHRAKSVVPEMKLSKLATLLRFMPRLAFGRLSGSYRKTPFFNEKGEPVCIPQVLTAAERDRAIHSI